MPINASASDAAAGEAGRPCWRLSSISLIFAFTCVVQPKRANWTYPAHTWSPFIRILQRLHYRGAAGLQFENQSKLSRPIGANRRWCGSGFPFGSFRPLSPCPGQRNRRHHLPLWPWRVEQVHRLLRLRRVRRRRQRCRDQQARSHRCQRVPAHQ